MDALDRVDEAARDLLSRVDTALVVGGAPADHRVWSLLGRLGALPGEAYAFFAELTAAPLSDVVRATRPLADGYRREHGALSAGFALSTGSGLPAGSGLSAGSGWSGATAEVVREHWAAVRAHLAGGSETLAGRLDATADHLDQVAAWIGRSRRRLAVAVARCLTSAEAVTLHTLPVAEHGGDLIGAWLAGTRPVAGPPRAVVLAAANLGSVVLDVAAQAHDEGRDLLDRAASRLSELRYQEPDFGLDRPDGVTRVRL